MGMPMVHDSVVDRRRRTLTRAETHARKQLFRKQHLEAEFRRLERAIRAGNRSVFVKSTPHNSCLLAAAPPCRLRRLPMPRSARPPAPEQWRQLTLCCTWPEQRSNELIRPMVLFGESAEARALATGEPIRTLYRHLQRFTAQGRAGLTAAAHSPLTLPPPVHQVICTLRQTMPASPPMRSPGSATSAWSIARAPAALQRHAATSQSNEPTADVFPTAEDLRDSPRCHRRYSGARCTVP